MISDKSESVKLVKKIGAFTVAASKMISVAALLALFASSAQAQVSPETPDRVLLKNKNTEKMFDVAEPSARMELHIEGIAEPVLVRYHASESDTANSSKNDTASQSSDAELGITVLYTTEKDKETHTQIASAYQSLSGSENVVVKDMSELKTYKR
ncbi:hypothetical protein ACFO4O_09820 [Glaciecola siphonariae]|uniref:Uncharacterized protein n=1 Tax=Glaciecola siphonariae TaxID=521012 RepID=A0ABV9LW24_9ALTE